MHCSVPTQLQPCKTVNAIKVALLPFLIDVEVQLSGEDVVELVALVHC